MSKATVKQKVSETVYVALDKDARTCGHQHLQKLSAFSCGFNSFGDKFHGVQKLSPTARRKLAE